MKIKEVRRIATSIFVSGFVFSTGFGALIDYVRTADSIQFVFGLALIAMGGLGTYHVCQRISDESEKEKENQ